MGHTVDIGYARKYLNATADHRKWLEDQLVPHRIRHHEQILAAEEVYRVRCAEPIGMTYPNTNYWDKWGPALNGFVYTCREEAARKKLEAAYLEADAEFQRNTEEIRTIYASRVRQAISRATGRGSK